MLGNRKSERKNSLIRIGIERLSIGIGIGKERLRIGIERLRIGIGIGIKVERLTNGRKCTGIGSIEERLRNGKETIWSINKIFNRENRL